MPRSKGSLMVAVDVLPKVAALWAASLRVVVDVRGKPRPKESLSVAVEVRGIARSTVSLRVAVDVLLKVVTL